MKKSNKPEAFRLTLIALVTVIGFTMAGCMSLGNTSENSNGSESSGGNAVYEWPSDAEFGRYGLSGLQQPSGTTVYAVRTQGAIYTVSLRGNKQAFVNLAGQVEGMSGWTVSDRQGKMVTLINSSTRQQVVFELDSGKNEIYLVAQNN